MPSDMSRKSLSEEAYAYTPGLKVKRAMTISRARLLPILGEVYVKAGDIVGHDTVVAKSYLSGEPVSVPAASLIGVDSQDLPRYVTKNVGDQVKKGEVIAAYNALFGVIKKQATSPIDGTIELVSDLTGQIIIRGLPVPVDIDAYIPGKVVKILPKQGAIIETNAAFVQGIFGIGGETHGRMKTVVDLPDKEMTASHITAQDKGNVLVGGSLVTLEALEKGIEIGVSCIVTGGARHNDVTMLMGEEIGVAITGQEEIGLTLVITEGFGKMRMSQRTFDLLRSFQGYMASVNGATQIRAGVLRPEIIIPYESQERTLSDDIAAGIVPKTPVRIIKQPHFGAIGEVVRLPVELQRLESESFARILEVRLDTGKVVTVPRANVEIIEE